MATFNSDATTMASPSTTGSVIPPRPSRSRTQSVSSDRPSTIAHSLMSAPLSVSPEAAFVAASAASQIVTNDHDAHSETWYDQVGIEPSGETALVSTGALQLANNFIDHILFNIIATAKSTRLNELRGAVAEVLKPKLAQDAINNADEELREYLGGGDIEDLEPAAPVASPRDWDLELAWKRTRLRCMVYSSLGDMEEEDEDFYMEQEHLRGEGDDILTESVSPAVAIFLTSILEFMGEQVLVVSGQAAFNRLRLKYEKELRDGSRSPGEIADRIIVDELDMERVALDRTFGRLWRAWKKRIRSPMEQNFSRPFSRNSFGVSHARRDSSSATETMASPMPNSSEGAEVINSSEEPSTDKDHELAQLPAEPTEVALPMSPRDVDEIEVPGLVYYSDDEPSDDEEYEFVQSPRRSSMIIWPARTNLSMPGASDTTFSTEEHKPNQTKVPQTQRKPEDDDCTIKGEIPENVATEQTEMATQEQLPNTSPARARASSQPSSSRRRRQGESGPKTVAPVSDEAEDPIKDATAANEDDTATSLPTSTAEVAQKAPEKARVHETPPVEEIAAAAAIVATTAAAAIGAVAASRAAGHKERTEEPNRELVDELDEEPQILTSSRVSVYGAPEGAMPSPIMPVRSNSIRSVRIIDVPSRSPTTRSRNSSVDTTERSASRGPTAAAVIKSPRMPTPPIAEEPWQKSSKSSAAATSVDPREVTQLAAPPVRNRPVKGTTSGTIPPPIKTTMPIEQDERAVSNSYNRKPTLPTLPERNASRPGYQNQAATPDSPKLPRQIVAESPTSASKFRAVRSSEDSGNNSTAPTPRPQDVARNFDDLIKSDQTLQYTLTPENMRDISASSTDNSIGVNSKGRRSEEAKLAERSRSSSIQRSMSVSKSNGLSSQNTTDSGVQLNGPIPSSGQYSAAKVRSNGSGQQARDARVPRESLQDFAAFIRSTGPPGEPAQLKRVPTGGSSNGYRPSAGPVPNSRGATHNRTDSANRPRPTARDATVTEGDSADLADFLRRGPPPAAGSNTRVQRQAPPPARPVPDYEHPVRNSQASTNITEASAPSSMNSSTALLGRNKPPQYSNNFDDSDMMPVRKQRRVRDPYAIDFSDEDEDEDFYDETPKPKMKPKQEESLIDFLKNYEPPPEPVSKPVAPPTLPKKRSASNLMARFRSNGHSSSGSMSKSQSSKPAVEPRSSPASSAAPPRGYTPITVNIPANSDKMGNFFEAPAPRPPQSSGRVPMKRFEPRDAVSSSRGTNDLAAFLRDSEPPPSNLAMQRPVMDEPQQPSGGFSRFRKKF